MKPPHSQLKQLSGAQGGKPEEYRFYKGDPNNDIQPVSKEALIGAIKKCHQTLWAGVFDNNPRLLPSAITSGELSTEHLVITSKPIRKRK
jgi:hypothetical protein